MIAKRETSVVPPKYVLICLMVNPGLHLITESQKRQLVPYPINHILGSSLCFSVCSTVCVQTIEVYLRWYFYLVYIPNQHFQGLLQEAVSTQSCSWSLVSCWVLLKRILVSFRRCCTFSTLLIIHLLLLLAQEDRRKIPTWFQQNQTITEERTLQGSGLALGFLGATWSIHRGCLKNGLLSWLRTPLLAVVGFLAHKWWCEF